jgi:hypothetical protein
MCVRARARARVCVCVCVCLTPSTESSTFYFKFSLHFTELIIFILTFGHACNPRVLDLGLYHWFVLSIYNNLFYND